MGKKIWIIAAVVVTSLGIIGAILGFQDSLLGKVPTNMHADQSVPVHGAPASSVDYDDQNTKNLKQELAINPNNIGALRGLAQQLWEKLPNYQEAPSNLVLDLLDTLLKLQSLDPQDKLTVLMLANLSFNQRVFDKSAQYYERYLILEPEDLEARANYSSVLTFLGKFDDSLRQIDTVVQKDPKSFQANAYRAITLAQMGRIEEAKKVGHATLQYAPSEEAKNRFQKFLASLEGQADAQGTDKQEANKDGAIIAIVQQSPIAGPKLAGHKIIDGSILELSFRNFPMAAMPPVAKDIFYAKVRAGNQQDNFKEVRFIDAATGTIMDTLQF